jgi:hypothetical protein
MKLRTLSGLSLVAWPVALLSAVLSAASAAATTPDVTHASLLPIVAGGRRASRPGVTRRGVLQVATGWFLGHAGVATAGSQIVPDVAATKRALQATYGASGRLARAYGLLGHTPAESRVLAGVGLHELAELYTVAGYSLHGYRPGDGLHHHDRALMDAMVAHGAGNLDVAVFRYLDASHAFFDPAARIVRDPVPAALAYKVIVMGHPTFDQQHIAAHIESLGGPPAVQDHAGKLRTIYRYGPVSERLPIRYDE